MTFEPEYSWNIPVNRGYNGQNVIKVGGINTSTEHVPDTLAYEGEVSLFCIMSNLRASYRFMLSDWAYKKSRTQLAYKISFRFPRVC